MKPKPIGIKSATLAKHFKAQRKDSLYQKAVRNNGNTETGFSLNQDGVTIRRAPVNETLQNLILLSR